MSINTILKLFLYILVKKSPKGYHVTLKSKFKFIIDFLNKKFPMLNDPYYKLGTKVYWFLHNMTDFPKCIREGCDNKLIHNVFVTIGYGKGYCSVKCEMNDPNHQHELQEIFNNKYGANSYPESERFKLQLSECAKNRTPEEKEKIKNKREKTTFERFGVKNIFCNGIIRTKFEDEREKRTGDRYWNNSEKAVQTRKLNRQSDPQYQQKINEKTAQTIQLRRDSDKNYDEKKRLKKQNTIKEILKINPNYYVDKKNKTIATNLKRTGYCWPSQNPEIRATMFRKYKYNGLNFDSAPEIAYYIWLTDNNIDFIYHPVFTELFIGEDGEYHHYEPDFLILSTMTYEDIKGSQFFKPKFLNCKNNRKKLEFMMKMGIRLILDSEYNIYMKYCQKKFGKKKWYVQFRNK